jgi:hypothetical protein
MKCSLKSSAPNNAEYPAHADCWHALPVDLRLQLCQAREPDAKAQAWIAIYDWLGKHDVAETGGQP